jgi:hypothetical protein
MGCNGRKTNKEQQGGKDLIGVSLASRSVLSTGWCHFIAVITKLKLGNACYYLVQNLLSSRLLSKNLKINIYRIIILPVFCMGVKLGR